MSCAKCRFRAANPVNEGSPASAERSSGSVGAARPLEGARRCASPEPWRVLTGLRG